MLKKLFIEAGIDFETFLKFSTKDERESMAQIVGNTKISEENLNKIKAIKEEINILLSAESWCPYVRATIIVLDLMSEINPKIKLRMITEGRGKMYMSSLIGLENKRFVVPTLAIMDKKFKFLGKYRGRPSIYRSINFDEIEDEFFTGQRANDILDEILGIINSK